MRILNICRNDFAGVAIKLTEALRQHTKHEARLLCNYGHEFGYPTDIVRRKRSAVHKWIDWADVVNCFGPLNVLQKKRPKNLIVTYVGSYFRNRAGTVPLIAKKFGAKRQIALAPWQVERASMNGFKFDLVPIAMPVDRLLKMKKKHKVIPIVCQSPSDYERKNTFKILKILKKNTKLKILIIHGVQWDECMRRKAEADIYIGSFKHAYGVSSLEAMAMKIPVIGHYPELVENALLKYIGYLPYYDCKLENLLEGIRSLCATKTYYKYADRGFNFMKKHHDYPVVARRFSEICEEVVK